MKPPASPFVSPGHWSYQVLRRLDNAGRLPRGIDLARQSIPQEEIAALLATADSVAGTAYAAQFRHEFDAPKHGKLTALGYAVTAGFQWTKDQLAPGIGYDPPNWSGARALDDESEELYGFRVGAALAPYLAIGADLTVDGDAQLIAAAGHLGAWVGRRPVGYATGASGGLVLNPHQLTGGGVFLTRPIWLPVLGGVRFEMHASKIDNVLNFNGSEHDIEPWFWTARGSFEPFGILRIGINRGMMFGGEGNTPVTFERIINNVVGFYAEEGESNFANQIISIDFRARVPGMPVTAYFDWGSDDAAGGWWDVPAILAGLEFTHVDSTFDVAVGAEHTQFARNCCSNGIWYRNAWFRGSWADGEDFLGHPLGGHGREWRLFANGSVQGGRFNGRAAIYSRRRREENVLAPEWQGTSTGFQLGADAGITPTIRIIVGGELESGADDWTASRLSVALRSSF
ncbi:MAG TPA: capsule assembly Wzi family protein [Longimicrobiales bacterium]